MLCVIKSLAKALGHTLYDAIARVMLAIIAASDPRLVEVALPSMDRGARRTDTRYGFEEKSDDR